MDVSIIFPVRNLEKEMKGILEHLQGQTSAFSFEIVIVDMGSDDSTLAKSLVLLRQYGLPGFVVQNGPGGPAAALNSGLHRAQGKYVAFLLASHLYKDILPGLFSTAELTEADMVFGSQTEEESRLAERQSMSRVVKKKSGAEYLQACLEGKLQIDLAAILLRRQFLLEYHLWFQEDCRYGYGEEFLYRCLLRAEETAPSPVLLQRESQLEWRCEELHGHQVFQRVEAMLRVRDILWCEYNLPVVAEWMTDQKIPQTIMECIDTLLREKVPLATVRKEMKARGFDRLLQAGKYTQSTLKKKIRSWKFPLRPYFPS